LTSAQTKEALRIRIFPKMQVPEEGSEFIAYIPSLLFLTIHDKLYVTDGMIPALANARAKLESPNPQSA